MPMPDPRPAMRTSAETPAWSVSGYFMLMLFVGLLVYTLLRVLALPSASLEATGLLGAIGGTGLCIVALVLIASGFYMIQPNQAAAITLFGSYRGTDRNHGLRWVWPWMGKTKISVRANNVVSEKLKVNDLRGNPI